jgi:hypothetical protein
MILLEYCWCVVESEDNTPDSDCKFCSGEGYRKSNYLERQRYWQKLGGSYSHGFK